MDASSPLRLSCGTMRIKLSSNNDDDLILDRDVVAAHCSALAPLLRAPGEPGYCSAWDKSKLVDLHAQDDEVRVFTLALKNVSGTLLLEGQDYDDGDSNYGYCPFIESEFADEGWPQTDGSIHMTFAASLQAPAKHHEILFKIIHGIPLDPRCLDVAIGNSIDHLLSWPSALYSISGLCSLAQFYGCLPIVAKEVRRVIETCQTLWEAVALDPHAWLQLSIKQRWTEVYFEALRHVLSRSAVEDDYVQRAAEALEMESTSLVDWSNEVLGKQAIIILQLNHDLQRLQLADSYEEYNKEKNVVRGVTFLNILKNAWPGRSASEKSNEKADFLARAIYGQWLAEQNGGNHIYSTTRRKANASGPLSAGLARLEEAAASANPPALFGNRVPQHLVTIFSLNQRSNSAKHIDTILAGIIAEADEIVKNAFEPYHEEDDAGVILTYRRCLFHGRARGDYHGEGGHFTFFGLDESDVPWAEQKEWKVDVGAVPASLPAADEAYVAAILQE